jgi:SPP1 gp7 family putative phage head morphogenesis protein
MAGSPRLPSNRRNPTGQLGRENRATADFNRRMKAIGAAYKRLLADLDFERFTVNAEVYEFRTLPAILAGMIEQTERLVDSILLEGGAANLWFLRQYVEPAYVQGTEINRANLALQSDVYRASRPNLRALLLSEPYQRRLSLLAAREFELMKGLSATTKSSMAQILTSGVATGNGPIAIARQLTAQVGIEQRRAERIARTEVNQALTNGRMEEAQAAERDLGLQSREMHLSALLPTTRATHAARHGTLHTVQAQKDWWSRDANRINCRCSTITVLVDAAGQPYAKRIVELALAQKK